MPYLGNMLLQTFITIQLVLMPMLMLAAKLMPTMRQTCLTLVLALAFYCALMLMLMPADTPLTNSNMSIVEACLAQVHTMPLTFGLPAVLPAPTESPTARLARVKAETASEIARLRAHWDPESYWSTVALMSAEQAAAVRVDAAAARVPWAITGGGALTHAREMTTLATAPRMWPPTGICRKAIWCA